MKLLLLGATGRTGKQILEQAVERGHILHVLVRDKQKVKNNHPSLVLFEGNPADKAALLIAMKGCEAVISALNISRTSDFPWSPLRSPKDLLSTVMKYVSELANGIAYPANHFCFGLGCGRNQEKIFLVGFAGLSNTAISVIPISIMSGRKSC